MVRRPVRLLLRKLGLINGCDHSRGVFPGSTRYWEQRYRDEGTSGLGSYGVLARVKARFINDYIAQHGIRSVVDFGAGDGNQLRLLDLPRYVGLDVSETAIQRLRQQFAADGSKRFVLCNGAPVRDDPSLHAELGLSLDVIYHLIEDDVYERYMHDLFHCAERHVIIFSSDSERRKRISRHVRHRRFSAFVQHRFPEWKLAEVRQNPLGRIATSDFFVYQRS